MKIKIKVKKNASAVIISLMTLMLVTLVIFSIFTIYFNKMNAIKNINDYYDKKIMEMYKLIKWHSEEKINNKVRNYLGWQYFVVKTSRK